MRLQKRGIRVLGVDFNPLAVRRWRELGLETAFGDATDPEFVAELPLTRAEWLVSTVPIHPTGISHEDTRTTLMQLTRSAGFRGRLAVASHHPQDTEELIAAGADLVLEPFQDAADRAVELLCGAPEEERTEIPLIETEGEEAP
ncbi:MAG: NAD-binding protein [Gammaproteobacteria bacterium]|nr:NAD-binding protein [Gammaproteobacteria bacterium]